ncbi:MFS transporter [Microtetraspora sp. NBRC 13810]|uniref:MFS transporter n=1 Tax=Microtetraspora sp. NBRC 13810 TaxID=3030990 RepID=UPI00255571A6|nr:MFS transporter [Microtetraspora sp. NBRC 13810]
MRARHAVSFYFTLLGLLSGLWAARIPAIKNTLDLTDGELGYALLALAAGLVTGMRFAGRVTDRHGSARVTVPAAAGVSLALIPAGYAPTLPTLIAALYLYGIANACLDVAMNTHGVEVERAHHRPLMSSFHAMYSIGGLAGGALGGLTAWLGLTPGTAFAATCLPLAALAFPAGRHLLPTRRHPHHPTHPHHPAHPHHHARPDHHDGHHDGHDRRPRGHRRWNGAILLIGTVAFAGLVGEGAAYDWTAVHLHDDLGASPALAATGFALFSAAMTAGRLAGDTLATRLGAVRLVRWSGLIAATGLGTGLLSGHIAVTMAGITLFGLGLSTIVPQVFSAAGNRDPARAGTSIAQVAALGYTGLVLGPVIIGATAELTGLTAALAIPAALALYMAAAATALRPPTPLPSTGPPPPATP